MHCHHGGGKQPVGAEMIDQRFDHIRQAGGGAGGCRNDAVAGRVVIVIVNAHDRGDGIIGHFQALGLNFKRRGHNNFFCSGLEMAAYRAPALIGISGRILEHAGGVHHQPHLIALPVNIFGIARLAQEGDRNAVDSHGAGGFIKIFDYPTALIAIDIGTEAAIGGILFNSRCYVFQTAADVPAQVDDHL